MLTLIENGELYDPEPRGRRSVLVANDRIEKIGAVDRRALDACDLEHEVIDARDCIVAPGLIDPHIHLLGGSGEGGPQFQTPFIFPREVVRAGVTSVVAVLGVDTTTRTVAGLLARVKGLKAEGIGAWMWTGGYNVPPTTVMGSIRDDMVFIDEVIGAGEVAISDERGLNQSAQELAKLVRDTHVGGLLSGKAGITHFHVGEEKTRLAPLREIIEEFQVQPGCLYATHIQRNGELLREAIDLANAGAQVDMDVVNEDIAKWLRCYIDQGGPLEQLTISSDADSSTPDVFYEQLCGLVVKQGFSLDLVLPLVTSNPARILKLEGKGRLESGCDADVIILERGSLAIRDVIARGKRVVTDGTPTLHEKFLEQSKRSISLVGDKFVQ